MRKLASIQEVQEVIAIPNADAICAYRINGWEVVDTIGKYNVGDRVVFCEVDSWIPTELAPFLSKGKEPREYQGIKGERLRTIKLRGQLSQGLLLPMQVMGDENYRDRSGRGLDNCWVKQVGKEYVGATDKLGADVSSYLQIRKWEPPPEFLNADAKGLFPSFIPKTDQERIQNCYKEVAGVVASETFDIEEKIEGQSSTIYFNNGEFGVCSRNLELKDSDNTFWNTARKYNLQEKLTALGRNIAIQSEQVGPGISGNIYKFTEYSLYVFDVYDIDKQQYFNRAELENICQQLELTPVPLLFSHTGELTLHQMLEFADGKSVLGTTGTLREGLVWRKRNGNRLTFKTVSNTYLQKHDSKD